MKRVHFFLKSTYKQEKITATLRNIPVIRALITGEYNNYQVNQDQEHCEPGGAAQHSVHSPHTAPADRRRSLIPAAAAATLNQDQTCWTALLLEFILHPNRDLITSFAMGTKQPNKLVREFYGMAIHHKALSC